MLKVFTNADKDPIHEDHDLKNLANHIRSSRILLSGPPHSGKSNILKNLIINQSPEFDEIYLFCADPDTKEYEQLDVKMVSCTDELPRKFEPDVKNLVIFEDLDYSGLTKKDISDLDRYLRVVASHKGVSIYMCCQNFWSLPAKMRRKVDVYYITRSDDATMSMLGRNFSIDKKKFRYLIDTYLSKNYDSLCFDSSGHPIKIRHNVFTPVNMDSLQESDEKYKCPCGMEYDDYEAHCKTAKHKKFVKSHNDSD